MLPSGDHSLFITRRFDRRDDGSKLHVQTLCAMAHFDRDGRYLYEQVFGDLRRLRLPETDMEQFYRRMVFKLLARNRDDHTKNHSFRMQENGEWQLAPAYDLLYACSSSGKWINQHQLSLNNKRDDFEHSDLISVAHAMGIRHAKTIIDQVTEIVYHWPGYAQKACVIPEHTEFIRKHHRSLTRH